MGKIINYKKQHTAFGSNNEGLSAGAGTESLTKGKSQQADEAGQKASLFRRFFPRPFDSFAPAIRLKIGKTAGVFLLGTALCAVLFISMDSSLWYLCLILFLGGAGLVVKTWYQAANGKIKDIEGVIIGKERHGYRRQNPYLMVQSVEGRVYMLYMPEKNKYKEYKEGDILRFFADITELDNLKDGVCVVNSVIAMERLSAKVTTDAEDEEIAKAAEDDEE